MKRVARTATILALAAILVPALVSACPLCKEAEANTPGGTVGFGRGIYYSILLMIAVPWTAVGTVAFLIFRKRKKSDLAKAAVMGKVAGTGPADLHPPQSTPAGIGPSSPESLGARS